MSHMTNKSFGHIESEKRYQTLKRALEMSNGLKDSVERQRIRPDNWSNISSIAKVGDNDFSYNPVNNYGEDIVSSSANVKHMNLSKNPKKLEASSEIGGKDKDLMPPPRTSGLFAHSSRRNSLNVVPNDKPFGRKDSESKEQSRSASVFSLSSTINRSPSMSATSQLQYEKFPRIDLESDDATPDRVFYNWRVMLNAEGHLLIKGFLENGKSVRSKPVVQRLSDVNVLSCYRNIYNLQGNIYDEKKELPKYIHDKFYSGFPYDWENVCQVWGSYVKGGCKPDFRWPQEFFDSDDDAASIMTEDIVSPKRAIRSSKTPNEELPSKNPNNSLISNKRSNSILKITADHSKTEPTTSSKSNISTHTQKLDCFSSLLSLNESKNSISTLEDIFSKDTLRAIFDKMNFDNFTAENIDKIMEVLGQLKYAIVRKSEMENELQNIKMKVLSTLFDKTSGNPVDVAKENISDLESDKDEEPLKEQRSPVKGKLPQNRSDNAEVLKKKFNHMNLRNRTDNPDDVDDIDETIPNVANHRKRNCEYTKFPPDLSSLKLQQSNPKGNHRNDRVILRSAARDAFPNFESCPSLSDSERQTRGHVNKPKHQHYQPEVVCNPSKGRIVETNSRENKENICHGNQRGSKSPVKSSDNINFNTQGLESSAALRSSVNKTAPKVINIEKVTMNVPFIKQSKLNDMKNVHAEKPEVPENPKQSKDNPTNAKNNLPNPEPSTSQGSKGTARDKVDKRMEQIAPSNSKEKEVKDSKNDKPKTQTNAENNYKKLVKWVPNVIKSPTGYGLVFEGKLLNDAGHIISAKFVTDFIIERISSKVIKTKKNEFYELKGDMSDPKHLVPKQLLKLCFNGCPIRIQSFCEKWIDLMTNDNSTKVQDITVDDLAMNKSSRGRRIIPILDYWNGERIALKDNDTVYNPGNPETSVRTSSSFDQSKTSSTRKQNRSISPSKLSRTPLDKSHEDANQTSLSRKRSLRARNMNRKILKDLSNSSSDDDDEMINSKKSRYSRHPKGNDENRRFLHQIEKTKNGSTVSIIKLGNTTAKLFKMPNKNDDFSEDYTSNA